MSVIYNMLTMHSAYYFSVFLILMLLMAVVSIYCLEHGFVVERKRYCKKHGLNSINDNSDIKEMFEYIESGTRKSYYRDMVKSKANWGYYLIMLLLCYVGLTGVLAIFIYPA